MLSILLSLPAPGASYRYRVVQGDSLGRINSHLGICPLWGPGRAVDRLIRLNPELSTRPNHKLKGGEILQIEIPEGHSPKKVQYVIDESRLISLKEGAVELLCEPDAGAIKARVAESSTVPPVANPVCEPSRAPQEAPQETPRGAPERSPAVSTEEPEEADLRFSPWISLEPSYLTTSQTLSSTAASYKLSGYSLLNARLGAEAGIGRNSTLLAELRIQRFSSHNQDAGGNYQIIDQSRTYYAPSIEYRSCFAESNGLCVSVRGSIQSIFSLNFTDTTALGLEQIEDLFFGLGLEYRKRLSLRSHHWRRSRLTLDYGTGRGQNLHFRWGSNLAAEFRTSWDLQSEKGYGDFTPFFGSGVLYRKASYSIDSDTWNWDSLGLFLFFGARW